MDKNNRLGLADNRLGLAEVFEHLDGAFSIHQTMPEIDPSVPDWREFSSVPTYEYGGSGGWTKLRYAAFRKYGNRCQCCGATPKDGKSLHVDHIKPKSKFPELALDINNLQILCAACNIAKRDSDQTDWR